MELIPVNITIADRTYRLKIAPKDEETVRKSVKIINDKIVEYKANLAGKDMQDFVSMVLLWFATEQTKTGQHFVQDVEINDQILSIENILEKALKQEAISA